MFSHFFDNFTNNWLLHVLTSVHDETLNKSTSRWYLYKRGRGGKLWNILDFHFSPYNQEVSNFKRLKWYYWFVIDIPVVV